MRKVKDDELSAQQEIGVCLLLKKALVANCNLPITFLVTVEMLPLSRVMLPPTVLCSVEDGTTKVKLYLPHV